MTKMKGLLLLAVLACLIPAGLFAQEDEGGDEIEGDWSGFSQSLYSMGDMTFNFSAGAVFPVLFYNNDRYFDSNQTVGATLLAVFDYFLGPSISVGGEVGLISTGSQGSNMLYVIPIGARVQYQFIIGDFEFPIAVSVGMCPTKFIEKDNFTMYARAAFSFYWRYNSDWSFGLNAGWTYIPMWTADPSKTTHGNYVSVSLAARYHF